MLMHQLLLDGAAREPDKVALRWVDRDVALTFAEAVTAMERCAGALHHLGVRKGDRVSIFAHNGMDYVLALFACWAPPVGTEGSEITFRFGLTAKGELRGKPLASYSVLTGSKERQRAFVEAALLALSRCTPVRRPSNSPASPPRGC